MTARIYTAAEAESLLAGTTPGPWRTYGNAAHDDAPSDAWSIAHDGITLAEAHADDRPQYDEDAAEVVEADADLMAAAPDLAASVAFHARRAQRLEADLTEAHDRARDAEAESAAAEAALVAAWQAVTNDDLPRLPAGDGTVVDAEAVGQRAAEVVAERDALRAIIEGRTPPTDAEIAAHDGLWLVIFRGTASLANASRMLDRDGASVVARNARLGAHGAVTSAWWALDAHRRPCAWPLVTEVTP